MTIREKVARAVQVPDRGRAASIKANAIAGVAITAFLEAAAEDGWHMRPDEATVKMRVAATESAPKDGSRAQGRYSAMLAASPKFEWDK